MSNSLQIQSLQGLDQAVVAATQAVIQELAAVRDRNQKLLLLLAGGSATKIYIQVAQALKTWPPDSLKNLSLAVEDERWPSKTNTQDIQNTGLIRVCTQLGATFYELQGKTMAAAANQFQVWLQTQWQDASLKTVAVIGIGADGHTLSVNADPDHPDVFAQLFESLELVVAYRSNATTAQFPTFPERISLTLTGLNRVTQVYGVVAGSDKVAMLQQLKTQTLPTNQQPAQALKQVPTVIFTDQNLI